MRGSFCATLTLAPPLEDEDEDKDEGTKKGRRWLLPFFAAIAKQGKKGYNGPVIM